MTVNFLKYTCRGLIKKGIENSVGFDLCSGKKDVFTGLILSENCLRVILKLLYYCHHQVPTGTSGLVSLRRRITGTKYC